MKRLFLVVLCLGLVSMYTVGCGTPTENHNHSNHNDNHNENKDSGTFSITASLEKDPPKTGQNILLITVKDKDGKTVEKATVTVDPQMPAHGHGSSEASKIEEVGQGQYKASPVTFQMAGDWEVTVTVNKGEESGRKTFKFSVK